ncbi:MAG: hypothetical protein E7256_07135 [Lachnospiraceae bacterium]|nr:hypothetical protein [Lachnospiraceae bacterium]
MRILLTALDKEDDASEMIVKLLNPNKECKKLYLSNKDEMSRDQLFKELETGEYDKVISFEQKNTIEDKIYIEIMAESKGHKIQTNFDYKSLCRHIRATGYSATISINAGEGYGNTLYYQALSFLTDKKANTDMIFLHIPSLNKITDFRNFARAIERSLDRIR